jgi:hypothetical protein
MQVPTLVLALERAIAALGWGELRYFLSDRLRDAEVPDSPPDESRVTGMIYPLWEGAGDWFAFFGRRKRMPVAIVDHAEVEPWPGQHFPLHRNMFHVTTDNHRAGHEMGTYLRRQGHRHAALLSAWEISPPHGWLTFRKSGIDDLFGRSRACSVNVFVADAGSGPEEVAYGKTVDHGVSSLVRHMRTWDILPERTLRRRFFQVYDLAGMKVLADRMQPSFDSALALAKASAWICINDQIAALALRYLDRKGVRVPEDISVVGFDNSTLALELGITSYDFSFDRLGHRAVHCLAYPHHSRRATQGRIREPGQLVERQSSGPHPEE